MRDVKNIADVAGLQPDYMGFIFYPHSARYVGDDFTLPEKFPAGIKKTGVWVNAPLDKILASIKSLQLDAVQLHGHESAEMADAIRQTGVEVIKVFSVGDDFDFRQTKAYEAVADYFLFDTKGKNYGGNAIAFNWELLKNYEGEKAYFLSGGLNLENLSDALALHDSRLYGLDFNSGLEITPGVKDISKVQQALQKLKKQN